MKIMNPVNALYEAYSLAKDDDAEYIKADQELGEALIALKIDAADKGPKCEEVDEDTSHVIDALIKLEKYSFTHGVLMGLRLMAYSAKAEQAEG